MGRQIAIASIVAFFLLPICCFVHELGHYFVAKSYGWTTTLMPAQVTYKLDNQTELQRIAFLLGGPIVDILQIGTGCVILYALRSNSSRSRNLLYWVGMVCSFVCVKWLMTPVFAAFVPMNDELQISQLLGWHPMLLPIMVMLLSIPILTYVIRQHTRHASWLPLACIPVFGFTGGALWVTLIGPMLLSGA